MIDELICMEMKEGKKVFSVSKLLARITYLIGGAGSGIGGRYIYNHFIKK